MFSFDAQNFLLEICKLIFFIAIWMNYFHHYFYHFSWHIYFFSWKAIIFENLVNPNSCLFYSPSSKTTEIYSITFYSLFFILKKTFHSNSALRNYHFSRILDLTLIISPISLHSFSSKDIFYWLSDCKLVYLLPLFLSCFF